jgi:hypothetical protein
MYSKKCEAATSESTPGNAYLPIGDGTEAQNANREIGVPRVRQSTTELKVELGHCQTAYPIVIYILICYRSRELPEISHVQVVHKERPCGHT